MSFFLSLSLSYRQLRTARFQSINPLTDPFNPNRFQHNILSNPIAIVNTALLALNFLNLPQGDILTKAEKHFKALKDTSLPLPIWYQDGLTKQ